MFDCTFNCSLIVARADSILKCYVLYVTVSLFSPPLTFIVLFAAETFLSMDTSSGSPTLDGLLMSTLSCGNFSNSTGYLSHEIGDGCHSVIIVLFF